MINFFSILLLIHVSCAQEPKVKKIGDLSQVEILNSIDKFRQYHTNSFRVNMFRSTDSENRFPQVNYIIGVLDYSEPGVPQLFKAGSFYNPEIMEGVRLKDSLKITVEHGEYTNRINSILIITRDGVEMK